MMDDIVYRGTMIECTLGDHCPASCRFRSDVGGFGIYGCEPHEVYGEGGGITNPPSGCPYQHGVKVMVCVEPIDG